MSTPSSEVPLISPIARIIAIVLDPVPFGERPAKSAPYPEPQRELARRAFACRAGWRPETAAMNAESFAPKSDFLRILTERGYIHQTSDLAGIDTAALEGRLTTY